MRRRRGERREVRGRRERRRDERRKCETVCLCASLPLGSNLGPHSMQEGETPRIQQSSVLDSGAPATHKESTKTSDRNVTECCTESYERKKGTVGGGREEEKARRGGRGGIFIVTQLTLLAVNTECLHNRVRISRMSTVVLDGGRQTSRMYLRRWGSFICKYPCMCVCVHATSSHPSLVPRPTQI